MPIRARTREVSTIGFVCCRGVRIERIRFVCTVCDTRILQERKEERKKQRKQKSREKRRGTRRGSKRRGVLTERIDFPFIETREDDAIIHSPPFPRRTNFSECVRASMTISASRCARVQKKKKTKQQQRRCQSPRPLVYIYTYL